MNEQRIVRQVGIPSTEEFKDMQEITEQGDQMKAMAATQGIGGSGAASRPTAVGAADGSGPKYAGQKPTEVTLTLDDGRVVVMGKPRVATGLIVQRIMAGEEESNAVSHAMMQLQIEALMYVRSIDGESIDHPCSMPEVQALMNRLENEGMQLIELVHQNEFRTKSYKDLNVIKKF